MHMSNDIKTAAYFESHIFLGEIIRTNIYILFGNR